MPAEYLRDPTVALLLLDEDIEVFYGENRQRVRFQGILYGGFLLKESVWERERRGLPTEYERLSLNEIDSVWVYLPLHDINDREPLEGRLVAGGCGTLGVPVGIEAMLGLLILGSDLSDSYMDIGTAIAMGYAALYGGSCIGATGGCVTGSYLYEKKVLRPPSQAKTQTLLDRLAELGGQGAR